MRKVFKKIHLWLSVPFGLIITLICFSGAMLVFENEVNELSRRDLYYVETVGEVSLPIEQLLEKVTATLPDSVSVTGVSISSDSGRAYQVNLSKPRRASLYVDQYTGEIKGKSERSGFFTFMFRMHRWLLDSMNPGNEGIFWGKMIVGVSTLLFVFVLISGIVIWWPRTRRALKNSLKISATKGWKRFWYDLHVAGGMYALLFLLAMSLTGLTWSFPWYRTAFYKVFGVEVQQRAAHGREQKGDSQKGDVKLALGQKYTHALASPFAYWQEIYDKLSRQNPGYKQISISSGTVNVSFNRFGNQRASDRYSFNTDNGEFMETSLYQHQDKSGKIRGWIYSVHVGNWGGMLTRILTFIAALIGAALPMTGYYLWIKKLMNKRKREKAAALSSVDMRKTA